METKISSKGNKEREVWKYGRKEGRKEGSKEKRRKEGRKERRKQERKQGRKDTQISYSRHQYVSQSYQLTTIT